jgi:hypothetical protein
MKRILLLFALILALGTAAMAAIAQGYTWESLSSADAIQAVCNFEGNPNLAVTLQDMESSAPISAQDYAASQLYHMTTDRYDYSVSQYSHTRFTRRDLLFDHDKPTFYGQPYDPVALTQEMMPEQAVVDIAKAFMQAHFPHPEVMFFTNIKPIYGDTYDANGLHTGLSTTFIEVYDVMFRQVTRPGIAKGPSYCIVTVDTVNGAIVGYYQGYFPLLTNTYPGMSGDEAMAIAMNAIVPGTGVPGTVNDVYVTFPDAMGIETVAYSISFGTTTDTMGGYIASVDALSGAILYQDILQGGVKPNKAMQISSQDQRRATEVKKQLAVGKPLNYKMNGRPTKLAYPPLMIADRPYLYAGYLAYGAPGTKLVVAGQQSLAIVGKQRQAGFRFASQTFVFNGKKRPMTGKPVIVSGAWYVPLDAARAVLGSSLTYDAVGKAVCFAPPAAHTMTAQIVGARVNSASTAPIKKP